MTIAKMYAVFLIVSGLAKIVTALFDYMVDDEEG